MNKRLILILLTVLITGNLIVSSALAIPVPPALNKDGSVVSGLLTADFDPSNAVLPFPTNLLFLGTTAQDIRAIDCRRD